MKAFKDYNETQEYTYSEQIKLPAGAYEVKIMKAEEVNDGNCLAILFDITGGECDKYYHEKFANDKKGNFADSARYKGVFKMFYPNGGQYDENNKRRMKTTLENIKRSNPSLNVDFAKEWDGAVLKGCKVGMIFRDQEWEYKGRTGFTAQPYSIITIDDYKSGKFTVPEPKHLTTKASVQSLDTSSNFEEDEDDDLPF